MRCDFCLSEKSEWWAKFPPIYKGDDTLTICKNCYIKPKEEVNRE